MSNYPIVNINGLGIIKKASIVLKPLLLLVGPNNSGKTYLMTLLYGLTKIRFDYATSRFFYINPRKECNEYEILKNTINKALNQIDSQAENATVELGAKEIVIIESLINTLIKDNKEELVQYAFNSDSIKISSLSILFPKREKIRIEIGVFPPTEKGIISSTSYDNDSVLFSFQAEAIRSKKQDVEVSIIGGLLQYVFSCFSIGGRTMLLGGNALFFPASRTGLLLSYQAILNDGIEASISQDKDHTFQYTRPVLDFIKFLNRKPPLKSESESNIQVLSLLNDGIIKGRIQKRSDNYFFIPSNKKSKKITMHLSSGVVTETTPLITALSGQGYESSYYIEEPEAGLHPKLQHVISRCIIRIVNSNRNVVVSTHSDIIVNHINNMIKLAQSDKEGIHAFMEKYGYDEDDLLLLDNISVYQFVVLPEINQTVAEPIIADDFGFGIPAFNDEFKKLLKESEEILEIVE